MAIRSDINWIVRLNWAHNGVDGTIPLPGQWDEFSKRCVDYLSRSKGANVVIIGNEPNHKQEWPHGIKIEPEGYSDCFNLCFRAITHERPDVEVLTAAVAPWDITSGIDWLAYYKRMLAPVVDCAGLAVHGYCHGADPNLIWSTEKTHGWYWHFPVIYQTIQAIPSKFATRPVHVTETDQGDNAWVDANTGWVQNAYESVNDHNRSPSTQKIYSLALYRWRGDKYEIYNKKGVVDDFLDAVEYGYRSPIADHEVGTLPPHPTPEPPEPPQPTPAPARDIDPRLLARGVHFDYVHVPAGTGYWRITKAFWLDEQEADAVGPDHHALGTLVRDGKEIADIPLRVDWPSGNTTVISKRDQPNASFNWDFPMSPSLNEYSVYVADGNPSDKASGIGMGKGGNPSVHTSTWIDFEWIISEGSGPGTGEPDPPPILPPLIPAGELVHPLPGAVITQRFGENPENYKQFGQSAHNGTDLGNKAERTPVCCIADGEVAYVGFDERGYGFYCRVAHPQLGLFSFYAHLAVSASVTIGQRVEAGQTIGLLGSTGNSSGIHLHIEIREMNPDGSYGEGQYGYTQGRVDPETVFHVLGSKL
jgi:murein DD-endopeptidase MepM/ murein hydrolase activator NlpD